MTDMPAGPDTTVEARETFGLDLDLRVPAFATTSAHVPVLDPVFRFQPGVTRAILAGFVHNRRVLVQGLHGTGKSSHIEQVAARLNWPCVRINLDGHISRMDLIGKDAVTVQDGRTVTEFVEGIVPWSLQRPVALVFDEYDAGRPDVMFVIQRLLEREGRLTLLDQSTVLSPHPAFRLFATSNTVGLGNVTGMYHGTHRLNHAQLDRWDITASLSYLPFEEEVAVVLARVPALRNDSARATVERMVRLAGLTRRSFAAGDLATLMSPRTVIAWAENLDIFGDLGTALRYAYVNKGDPDDEPVIAEYFQRCFGTDLEPSAGPQPDGVQGDGIPTPGG